MTRDEAVALIGKRLGNRTDLDTWIVDEMKNQQDELEQSPELPWFLLSLESTADTVIGQERLHVPADFLREYDEGALWITDAAGVKHEVIKDDYDALFKKWTGEAQGRPEEYALVGKYLHLFPTPDAIYEMEMLYFKQDAVLSTNITNEWLTHAASLLLNKTGLVVATFEANMAAAAGFTGEVQKASRRLFADNVARMEMNRQRLMGD